jgi:hypothetical protein
MWNEVVVVYFETLSRHLPGGTEEHHEKVSVRIVCVPSEIQIGHLLNTNNNHYRFSELILFRQQEQPITNGTTFIPSFTKIGREVVGH